MGVAAAAVAAVEVAGRAGATVVARRAGTRVRVVATRAAAARAGGLGR